MTATITRDQTGQYLLADVLKEEKLDGIFCVPGRPLTKTQEALAAEGLAQWTNHEAVAVQQALGVAAYGGKSAALMKQVGMHAALDMLAIAGPIRSGGAMLVVVGDDPGAGWSNTEGDARLLSDFCELPCVEPAGPEDVAMAVADALMLSAHMHTPVVLRTTTPMLMGREVNVRQVAHPTPLALKPYDPAPAWTTNTLGQRKRLIAELHALSEEGTTTRRRGAGPRLQRVVACGEPAALAELAGGVDLLVVRRVVPIPRETIAAFVGESTAPVLVLESGHPYLEDFVRGCAPRGVEVLGRHTGHVPWAGIVESGPILAALAEGRTIPEPGPEFVAGDDHADLSGYGTLFEDAIALGLTPTSADAGMASAAGFLAGNPTPLTYGWGCPIGVAAGIALKTGKPALAVAGDGGTFHSGFVGLIQAVRDQSQVITVVLDDGVDNYTGAQPNPGSEPGPGQRRVSLAGIARGIGVEVVETIDSKDARSEVLRPLLTRLMAVPGPSMLIIEHR